MKKSCYHFEKKKIGMRDGGRSLMAEGRRIKVWEEEMRLRGR